MIEADADSELRYTRTHTYSFRIVSVTSAFSYRLLFILQTLSVQSLSEPTTTDHPCGDLSIHPVRSVAQIQDRVVALAVDSPG